jgi:hypothetical protein
MSASTTSPPLPDINAETYPFEVVQYLLDQAAHLNFLSVPKSAGSAAMLGTGSVSGVIGVRIREALHRFSIVMEAPSVSGLRVQNLVGERLASFEHRWMFAPEKFGALPGLEPPPVRLDPSRSQRFVMLDAICKFNNGKDGFRGFGTGRTFPVSFGGNPEILVGAVGNIVEGYGKFRGLAGTYTYCGALSPDAGFQGSMLCRVVDPDSVLRSSADLPDLKQISFPESGASYLTFRGQKKNRTQKTQYTFDNNGEVNGLQLDPQIRLFYFDCAIDGRGELRSTSSLGPVIGTMPAYIFFNVLNPGAPGTGDAPIAFHDYDEYIFSGPEGGTLGSFGFDGGGGRTLHITNEEGGGGQAFNLRLQGAPGQKALRFGGFGPVVNGKGQLNWFHGLTAHNSVVGIAPHVLSTAFIARIYDPTGRLMGRGPRLAPDAVITNESGGRRNVYIRKD